MVDPGKDMQMASADLAKQYELAQHPIGQGAYGFVYKGIFKETGEVVALKRTKIENFNDGIPSTTLREISILHELDHTNIVKLKDVVLTDTHIWFVQEFCNMDLSRLLREIEVPLQSKMIRSFIKQILEGVRHCHETRIIHRDLKPANILLAGPHNNQIKIADFGLARAFSIPIKPYTKDVVTLYYRSPELLLKMNEYATPIDIWSVGCIFAELATKKPIFAGQNEHYQLNEIFRFLGTPNEEVWEGVTKNELFKQIKWTQFGRQSFRDIIKPDLINDAGLDLLEKMLEYEPSRRITARQALLHPYFSD